MFRRRPDLSWPLIALLAGLFILSLRMPRQWERIARDSSLAFPSRAAAQNDIPPAPSSTASNSTDPATYQTVEPTAAVATNVEAAASSDTKLPSAVVIPVAASTTTAQNDSPILTARASNVENAIAAERSIPTPQSEPIELADATCAVSGEVQVLRDTSASPDSHSAGAEEHVASSNPSFGRLPAPEPQTSASQPQTQPSDSANISGPTFATAAVPAQTVPAAQQAPAAEPAPTPARPVAPEPRLIAADLMPQPSIEPVVSLPSPASVRRDPAPEPQSNPAAQSLEPAAVALQDKPSRPMKAIGRAWEEPASLLAQLEKLKSNESAKDWAVETISEIRKLGPAIAVGAPQTAEILGRLDELVHQATAVAAKTDDDAAAKEVQSASFALARRLVIWKQIGQMGGLILADAPAPTVQPALVQQGAFRRSRSLPPTRRRATPGENTCSSIRSAIGPRAAATVTSGCRTSWPNSGPRD